jgi:hypothetical protein
MGEPVVFVSTAVKKPIASKVLLANGDHNAIGSAVFELDQRRYGWLTGPTPLKETLPSSNLNTFVNSTSTIRKTVPPPNGPPNEVVP